MSNDGQLNKKKVLIVDNTRAAATILRNMVRKIGAARVDEADSYHEAVPMLKASRYDIVFCDVDLGDGLSGQQLLRDAREFGLMSLTSIFVFVSSEQTRDMVLGSIEHEPDGYIVKPFRLQELEQRTQRFIARNDKLEPVLSALDNDNLEEAEKQGEQIARGNRKLQPVMLNYLARYRFKNGDYDGARKNFTAIRKIHDLHWAKLGEAQCMSELGYLSQAEEAFESILAKHPYATPAIDGIARIHEIRNDQQKCYERIRQGSQLSPLNVNRLERVSEIAQRLGIWDQSVESCRRIFKLTQGSWKDHPEHRTRYFRAALKWLEADADNNAAYNAMEKAFDDAKESLKEYPDDDGIRFNYAMLTASKNNKDEGMLYSNEVLEKIVEHYPEYLEKHNEALGDLTMAFERSRDKGRAEAIPDQVREKAYKARKKRLEQRSQAASKAYRKGDLNAALENFLGMLEDNPSSITLNLNIAHLICIMAEDEKYAEYNYQSALPYLKSAGTVDDNHHEYRRYVALKRSIIEGLKAEGVKEDTTVKMLNASA